MCAYFCQAATAALNLINFRPNLSRAAARPIRSFVGLAFGAAFSGCSMHPIPDQASFGRVPTEDIVARARCEIRAGLLEHAIAQILIPEERQKFRKKIEEENEKLAELILSSKNVGQPVKKKIAELMIDPRIGGPIREAASRYANKTQKVAPQKSNIEKAIGALDEIVKSRKVPVPPDAEKAFAEAIKTLRTLLENHAVIMELDEVDKRAGAFASITEAELEEVAEQLQTARGRGNLDQEVLGISKGISATIRKYLGDYASVAAAYDFDFQITEVNDVEAGVGFKLPWKSPGLVDFGIDGKLHKTRVGKRTFAAQETFGEITVTKDHWCDKQAFKGPARNLMYPMTGSIGMRKVVRTFVKIVEQGGGKDSFVDVLTFTTVIGGSLKPTLKLKEVPGSFRLVNATVDLSGERTDLHSVKISLVFPKKKEDKKPGDTEVQCRRIDTLPNSAIDSDLAETCEDERGNHYILNPVWLARFNLCLADGRDREDKLKVLRFAAPEMYCVTYANALVPRRATAPRNESIKTGVKLKEWWYSG